MSNLVVPEQFPNGLQEFIDTREAVRKPREYLYARAGLLFNGENVSFMHERLCEHLGGIELNREFNTPNVDSEKAPLEVSTRMRKLYELLEDRKVILGTQAIRGITLNQPASSCSIPIKLELSDRAEFCESIRRQFKSNQGIGINLSDTQEPVERMLDVHRVAEEVANDGEVGRRNVGNMILFEIDASRFDDPIYMSNLYQIISAKRTQNLPHYNISLVVPDSFMEAAQVSGTKEHSLLFKIADAARDTGDPGILFKDRLNRGNPNIVSAPYSDVPPCCEIGLAKGELCHFSFLDLSKFVKAREGGGFELDYGALDDAVEVLTYATNDMIDHTLSILAPSEIPQVRDRRKIGIGVAGVGDLLVKLGITYDSDEALKVVKNLVGRVNFKSKSTSHQMGLKYGSPPSMGYEDNLYRDPDFLKSQLGSGELTSVPSEDIDKLAHDISETGALFNPGGTVALPPTGVTARLLGTSFSIEPQFKIYETDPDTLDRTVKPIYTEYLKSRGYSDDRMWKIIEEALIRETFQGIADLASEDQSVLRKSDEIPIAGHLGMCGALAGKSRVVDDGLSKTLTFKPGATSQDVMDAYLSSYGLDLLSISVYVAKGKVATAN